MHHRNLLAGAVCAASAAAAFLASASLAAHGSEARLVRELAWKKPRIARALAVNRSELGLSGSKVPAEVQTIAGQPCVVGPLVALDVDDQFAFDIDEAVDVTLTYATPMTTPFTVAWDRNGGDGYGVSTEITPSPGAGPHTVTLRLDRARFAGQGILKTDLAVGARGGTIALCDIQLARTNTTAAPASFGQLRLEVKDGTTGAPCRLASASTTRRGRTPLPSDRRTVDPPVRRRSPAAVGEPPHALAFRSPAGVLRQRQLRRPRPRRHLRSRRHPRAGVSRLSRQGRGQGRRDGHGERDARSLRGSAGGAAGSPASRTCT